MQRISLVRILAVVLAAGLVVPPAEGRDPIYGRKGMVVAQESLAAHVGIAVLKSGGNAVDAAVAVGFALAVTHPFAGNLGGGGFMLVRLADGRSSFIDFREAAPARASHDMYLDSNGAPTRDSIVGWRASGIPGTVRGLELAHKKFGSKAWAALLQPAIDLAAKGFPVSRWQMESWREYEGSLSKFAESKRIFLKGGAGYEWQENFRQPELAGTLGRIAATGSRDFYEGETAKLIADAMAKNGGLITIDDLRGYRAMERTPLEGEYHGYHIITSPPPSSGGVGILQMAAMLDGSGYEAFGAGSAGEYHYLAEVMRRFYADRSSYLGDPGFVKNPIAGLLDPAYVHERRASIDPARATPSEQVSPGLAASHEGANTTHFSIVDGWGNCVALTYTLNNGYGSAVTVPGAGFLLNDEMDDFSAKPGTANMFGLVQGENNSIAPGKRPLSSMTPTIITKDGKPFLVLGAPGGATIISAVLQVLLDVIDFHMNVQDAVDFPRVHQQWKPDVLVVERGVSPDTVALLAKMGYTSREGVLAEVQAIEISEGWLEGAVDERGPGEAAGY